MEFSLANYFFFSSPICFLLFSRTTRCFALVAVSECVFQHRGRLWASIWGFVACFRNLITNSRWTAGRWCFWGRRRLAQFIYTHVLHRLGSLRDNGDGRRKNVEVIGPEDRSFVMQGGRRCNGRILWRELSDFKTICGICFVFVHLSMESLWSICLGVVILEIDI